MLNVYKATLTSHSSKSTNKSWKNCIFDRQHHQMLNYAAVHYVIIMHQFLNIVIESLWRVYGLNTAAVEVLGSRPVAVAATMVARRR